MNETMYPRYRCISYSKLGDFPVSCSFSGGYVDAQAMIMAGQPTPPPIFSMRTSFWVNTPPKRSLVGNSIFKRSFGSTVSGAEQRCLTSSSDWICVGDGPTFFSIRPIKLVIQNMSVLVILSVEIVSKDFDVKYPGTTLSQPHWPRRP